KLEQDKIDQWNVNEKKRIIESITTLFKSSERHLEEMIKKNRFFTSEDSLKSKVFKDILPQFDYQFIYLKEQGKKFIESLDIYNQKFNEFKARASQIDIEAEQKLATYKDSLNMKLRDRDKLLNEFESEKQVKISELQHLKNQIEDLFTKIKEIVQIKHDTCLQEAQKLTGWSLNDNQSDLFSRPIQWIYMPLYAMFIEDESKMEEYMNILFPGYITNDPKNIYENVSDAFISLRNIVLDKVENDMPTRSNFEFSCERKNLIKDPNLKKRLQLGVSKLREKMLINEAMERIIRENLNSLP
ncbi:MAG: hypothetical protein ACFFDN_34305, partial [Candidatus Hodarchaeota archaeon]